MLFEWIILMKSEPKSTKEISVEAVQDIRDAINHFLDKLEAKTKDTDDFLTMDQLENMFSELDSKTRKIYLDMIADSLSSINEKDIIRSKKEN